MLLSKFISEDNIGIKNKHDDPFELVVYRCWLLIVVLFFPVYGVFLEYFDPNANDFLVHRTVFALIALFLFAASFKVPWVKDNLALNFYTFNYLMMTWVLWIVYFNQYNVNYSLGQFLVLFCICLTFRKSKHMIYFSLYVICVIGIMFLSLDSHPTNPYLYFLTVFISLLVCIVYTAHRENNNENLYILNQELKLLNATLEDKVKERTKEVEEKSKLLMQKNQELARFASIASHDLVAPLNTVHSYAKILNTRIKPINNASLNELTYYIIDGVHRMKHLTKQLLEHSKMEKLKKEFSYEDASSLLKIVIHDINFMVQEEKAKIFFSNTLLNKLICNKFQIKQLFQNLIINGIKYNTSEEKTIKIDAYEKEDAWFFTVEDNGIGIPEKYKAQAFEMFRRLPNSKNFQGSGIGLGTCKKIVDNHEGAISFTSEIGNGSIFTFSISKKLVLDETSISQLQVANKKIGHNAPPLTDQERTI